MIVKKYIKVVAKKSKDQWLNPESNVKNFIFILKKKFGSIKSLKVLDAGCAQGRDSYEISEQGPSVQGIDYDENFITEAKKLHPKIKFKCSNIESLPFKDESFDSVYCVNTLFYTNLDKSLPELERVLKKGGVLFITLDEEIINLDEDKIIHKQDIEPTIKLLKNCILLSKNYLERIDQVPFKHKHSFYELAFLKE